MIKIGDRLPEATFTVATPDGPGEATSASLFAGKKTVVFAVPGAYTPTCHGNHMPGFLTKLDALAAKGVSQVACLSVNDVFVMKSWGEATGALGKITLIADGSAAYTQSLGLELDLTDRGLGVRSKRYAMVVDDGAVSWLAVEETPATADASGAEAVLAAL